MLLCVVSAVFAVLALAGIGLVFTQGQFATVDGLFFTGILGLIAVVFGANAAFEFRTWRKRRAPSGPAEKATGKPAAAKPAEAVAQAEPQSAPAVVVASKPAPESRPASGEDQYPVSAGALLVREGIELPEGVTVSGAPFVPGWKLVERPQAREFKREVEQAGWHVLYLAAQSEGATWDLTREEAEQRVVGELLDQLGTYNAFEISRRQTRHRFGWCHVAIWGHVRHIQKNPFLAEREQRPRSFFSFVIPSRRKKEEEIKAA